MDTTATPAVAAPPTASEKWLAGVTIIAGLCLMAVGVIGLLF